MVESLKYTMTIFHEKTLLTRDDKEDTATYLIFVSRIDSLLWDMFLNNVRVSNNIMIRLKQCYSPSRKPCKGYTSHLCF